MKPVSINQASEERWHNIRENFEAQFPEIHARMSAASDPVNEYQQILKEHWAKLVAMCAELGVKLDADEGVTGDVIITGEDQSKWDNAHGETIEVLIQSTLDGLERLKGLTDAHDTAAQLIITGLMAVSYAMMAETIAGYVAKGIEAAATLLGVEAATVGVVVLAAVVVVLAVLVPVLYFMSKNAQSVLMVINKTGTRCKFKGDYCEDGKRVLYTDEIHEVVVFDEDDPSYNRYAGGLYSYVKCDSAMIGSQAAFRLQMGETEFNIAVKNPLNGDSGIEISTNKSVENAAKEVKTQLKQTLRVDNRFVISAEGYPKGGQVGWFKVLIEPS